MGLTGDPHMTFIIIPVHGVCSCFTKHYCTIIEITSRITVLLFCKVWGCNAGHTYVFPLHLTITMPAAFSPTSQESTTYYVTFLDVT